VDPFRNELYALVKLEDRFAKCEGHSSKEIREKDVWRLFRQLCSKLL